MSYVMDYGPDWPPRATPPRSLYRRAGRALRPYGVIVLIWAVTYVILSVEVAVLPRPFDPYKKIDVPSAPAVARPVPCTVMPLCVRVARAR